MQGEEVGDGGESNKGPMASKPIPGPGFGRGQTFSAALAAPATCDAEIPYASYSSSWVPDWP